MRTSWVVTPALCLAATVATLQGAWSTSQVGSTGAPAPTEAAAPRVPTEAPATAQPGAHVMAADRLTWGDGPPALPKGARLAVLHGDPAAADGPFTVRVKFPDGYKVMPHTHPTAENVTVLSGALRVGMGREWNEASMQELSVGGYGYMPPATPHYAHARGETVLQIHGTAPFALTYVNPADDPRTGAARPSGQGGR